MTIRVLHVIDGLGASGGSERQLARNLKYLDDKRFEHHVAHVWAKDELVPEIEARGIPVYSLGITGGNQWLRGIWRLIKLIRQHRIDLVHTSLFQSEMMGGIAGRITGRPVVGSLVNLSYGPEWLVDNPGLSNWKLRVVRTVRSLLLRTCYAHMTAVSVAAKSSAIENLGISAEKISVVHRGLNPEWMEEEPSTPRDPKSTKIRNLLGVSNASPLLVSIGRLSPQKGQRYLLEAMSDLRIEFPDIKLLIVGEKTIGQRLESRCAELHLEDCVEFLGVRHDVKELLIAADICVYPSLYEGFPNAAVEAAAMGRPTVVTKISPYQEVLEDNVTTMMVESRSVDQLVVAITRLADDPVRASEMGSRAREHVTSQYRIESTVKKLAELYEQLHLGRRRTSEFVGID